MDVEVSHERRARPLQISFHDSLHVQSWIYMKIKFINSATALIRNFVVCYCSFWIVVKVMADGNVPWDVCWHRFLFSLTIAPYEKIFRAFIGSGHLRAWMVLNAVPHFICAKANLQSETGLCPPTPSSVTFPVYQHGLQESEAKVWETVIFKMIT